jgi:DDE superfamily endonuclease
MSDPDVEIWAMDGVLFQLHGSTCHMWVPPEVKQPIAFMQPNRKAVGYFGAVNIGSGRFIHRRPEGNFNAETTWQFFRQLESLPLEDGKVRAIILDNARYHHALLHQEWRTEVADHLRFVFLPPYSPELNPCERVWKLTRRLCTHNRLYSDLKNLEEVITRQYDGWELENDALRKLCAMN